MAPPSPLSPIPGPNILLQGESGTGKTHSIRTLLDVDITPFIVFTEPGMEVLGDIKCPDLHWHYEPPGRQDWATMIDAANKVNTLPMKAIADLPDISKAKFRQFMEILTNFQNFTCSRCGKHFGDVTEWDTDRALVLDSLSGLNIIAMDHVVGGKPVKSVQNWGVAMDGIEKLINKLTLDTYCTFILTAHLEQETDEVTGAQKVMVSTLGRRLAPRIPRFFSDVIQTTRSGKDFTWTTTQPNVVSKARNVPWASNIPPTFVEVFKVWAAHGGVIAPHTTGTVAAAPSPVAAGAS